MKINKYMRYITFTFLLILAIQKFGQAQLFFDSLDFFKRTHTKQIILNQKREGLLFRTSVGHFDKAKGTLTWCAELVGKETECGDTLSLNLFNQSDNIKNEFKKKLYFDKFGRLTKSIESENKHKGQTWVTEYFYVDSVSRRLKLIVQDSPNSYTQVTSYHYENNKLVKSHEIFYGLGERKDYERTRTYTYEYYPDLRLKTETVANNGIVDFVGEFSYVDDKK